MRYWPKCPADGVCSPRSVGLFYLGRIMKLIVEVKDNRARFVTELLESLSFVKVRPFSDRKTEVLDGIREAVAELRLVKKGKLKVRKAEDVLNEL